MESLLGACPLAAKRGCENAPVTRVAKSSLYVCEHCGLLLRRFDTPKFFEPPDQDGED